MNIRKDAILFGGTSAEKLVSVATAQNLGRYLSTAIFYFWNDQDMIVEVEKDELMTFEGLFVKIFEPKTKPSLSLDEFFTLAEKNLFVFLALHGGRGENGWIQKKLEDKKIPFSGSGSVASALCMDKARAKAVLKKHEIKVPDEFLFHGENLKPHDLQKFFDKYKKIVVKPVTEGSSRGIFIIKSQEELTVAITQIIALDMAMLAEEFVGGRELTIGVLSTTDGLHALCPSEVVLEPGATFDYEGKYLGRGSIEITPAKITDEEKKLAQAVAIKAHEVFGCRGCSRTEIIFNENGYYFLETNTLPGLTKASFIPQQLAAEDMSMTSFLQILKEETNQ